MIDDAYKRFVSGRPCALCPAPAPSDPHHLRNRAWREVNRNDATCVPLCRQCHDSVHAKGLATTLGERGITIRRLVETVANQLVEYFVIKAAGVNPDPSLPF